MAQAGPYRERLGEHGHSDRFWRLVRFQRLRRRWLPVLMTVLALTPAVAIAVTSKPALRLPAPLPSPELAARPDGLAQGPWGFTVTPKGLSPWTGRLPASAPRPGVHDSPITADAIQAAVLARAHEFHECHVRALADEPGLGGVVIASLLIRRDGKVHAVVGGDAKLVQMGVSACVERSLDELSFPAPGPDYGWVHLPVRFEPSQADDLRRYRLRGASMSPVQ